MESTVDRRITEAKFNAAHEAVAQAKKSSSTAVEIGGEYLVLASEELDALKTSGVEFVYLDPFVYAGEERILRIPSSERVGAKTKPEQDKGEQPEHEPKPKPEPEPSKGEQPAEAKSESRYITEKEAMNRTRDDLLDDVFEVGGWEVSDDEFEKKQWLTKATEHILKSRKANGVVGRAMYATPSKKEVVDALAVVLGSGKPEQAPSKATPEQTVTKEDR
jgi:hypothetical protein